MFARLTHGAVAHRRVGRFVAARQVLFPLPFLTAVAVSLLLIVMLTGAVARSHSPVDLELLTLRPTTFRVDTEQAGVIEPFRSDVVTSKCYWTTEILSIVPEGTWVQKGDVVCVLNSSEIEEKARQREVSLIRYRAGLDNALHEQQLLKPENERRQTAARFNLQMAEGDLDEYTRGTFPQQTMEMEKNMALYAEQSRVAQDDLQRVESLWVTGLASRREMEQASLQVTDRQEKFDQLESKYRLRNDFLHPRSKLQLEFRRSNAERELLRTENRNSLEETKARLTMLSYERSLQIYERYYKRAIDSIKACTLKAPRDGQVVYGNSWYLKSRGVTQIEEGKRVRYRQKLFEIPDQRHLKVSVPIHEALISHVFNGMPASVQLKGYEKEMITGAVVAISRYPRVRSYYTPDVKDYWLDIELQLTPEQRTLVRPKMDAAVHMTVTEIPDAVCIPRDAVVGSAAENFVWVYDGNELQARKVQLGEANDSVVCVISGVDADEQIAVNLTQHHKQSLTRRLAAELQR